MVVWSRINFNDVKLFWQQLSSYWWWKKFRSLGECNTILSAYTLYCTHLSRYSNSITKKIHSVVCRSKIRLHIQCSQIVIYTIHRSESHSTAYELIPPFVLDQIQSICRRQSKCNWKIVVWFGKGSKHYGKRLKGCLLAFSPFPTIVNVFIKRLFSGR